MVRYGVRFSSIGNPFNQGPGNPRTRFVNVKSIIVELGSRGLRKLAFTVLLYRSCGVGKSRNYSNPPPFDSYQHLGKNTCSTRSLFVQ